ncbi:MAG: DCC1-like thiol-disulfide oxidoreductase family protein [Vicinamibacterales bacterium]
MHASTNHARKSGPHLILFDGECSFCAGWVQFVLARDPQGTFHFASAQSDAGRRQLAQAGHSGADLKTVYVITSYTSGDGTCLTRSDAAAFIASQLGGRWSLAGALLRVVPRQLRDAGYDVVARYRHQLGASATVCLMPTAEQRQRFLDR